LGEGQPNKFNRKRFEICVAKRELSSGLLSWFIGGRTADNPEITDQYSLLQSLQGTSSHCLQSVMNEQQNHLGIYTALSNLGLS